MKGSVTCSKLKRLSPCQSNTVNFATFAEERCCENVNQTVHGQVIFTISLLSSINVIIVLFATLTVGRRSISANQNPTMMI